MNICLKVREAGREEEDESEQLPSSESSKPEEKPKMYYMRKSLLGVAAGYEERGYRERGGREREKIKATPEEVLAALPKMTRDEKKKFQALMKEEHEAAYERLHRSHLLPQYESSEEEQDPWSMGTIWRGCGTFRQELYDKQMTRSGLRATACAPTPKEPLLSKGRPYI